MYKIMKYFLLIMIVLVCLCGGIFFLTGCEKKQEESGADATYYATFKRTDNYSISGFLCCTNDSKITGDDVEFELVEYMLNLYNGDSSKRFKVSQGDWICVSTDYLGSHSSYVYKIQVKITYSNGEGSTTMTGFNELWFQWGYDLNGTVSVSVVDSAYCLIDYDANGGSLETANTFTKAGDEIMKFVSNSSGYRLYSKTNSGWAIKAWSNRYEGWSGPHLVSNVSEAVTFSTSGNHMSTTTSWSFYKDSVEWFTSGRGAEYNGGIDVLYISTFVPMWKYFPVFNYGYGDESQFELLVGQERISIGGSSWNQVSELSRVLLDFYKEHFYRLMPKGSALPGHNPTPTRDGYTFMGWNTKKDGSGTYYSTTTTINANTTLYAIWEANITFDPLEGGSASVITGYGNGISDALICTMNGRNYYKYGEGVAIAGIRRDGDGDSRYSFPVLISRDYDAATYVCDACGSGANHPPTSHALYIPKEDLLVWASGLEHTDESIYYYLKSGTYSQYDKNINIDECIYLYCGPTSETHSFDAVKFDVTETSGNNYTIFTQNSSVYVGMISKIWGQTRSLQMAQGDAMPNALHFSKSFVGWFTKDGTTSGDWGEEVTADTVFNYGGKTLYAKFVSNKYAVSFDAGIGSFTENSKPSLFDEASGNIVDAAETLLLSIENDTRTFKQRDFYKLNNGKAYVFMSCEFGDDDADDINDWTGPLLLSNAELAGSADAAKQAVLYRWCFADGSSNGEKTEADVLSCVVDGVTWYFAYGAEYAAIQIPGYIQQLGSLNRVRVPRKDMRIDAEAVLSLNNLLNNKIVNVSYGETVELPSVVAPRGYRFAGWWTKDGTVSGDWVEQ